MQRERIMGAMVQVVAERGYADASLDLVVARAGVSRRTFYRCFENCEACFRELLDLAWASGLDLIATAFMREAAWQDGVRSALASLLAFMGSESLLARVCLVEALAAGPWALEHRECNLGALRGLVIAHWPRAAASGASPLAVEGATASVLGVIQTHIVTGRPEPLLGLLGPLAGLVAAQFLPPHLVAREVELGDALGRTGRTARRPPAWTNVAIPAALCNPNAHRARCCVLFLAGRPRASNREIAAAIGVAHESQISKLLASLFAERLVAKHSEGLGKRNAWQLTRRGEEIARRLEAGEAGRLSQRGWILRQ
jgi:AcrR family transcriptional regulator